MRLYVAGPMRGLPNLNFPAFDAATATLRAAGHSVFSPAERDRALGFDETLETLEGFDLAAAMRDDLDHIVRIAEGIALLPGWERSKGATIERRVAEATGKRVFLFDGAGLVEAPPPPETVLEEAQRLVYGPRQNNYGHPADDFTRTGRMWAAILGVEVVTPAQVALCMCAVKISRECHRPKRDNLTDLAGYAATLALVRERESAP